MNISLNIKTRETPIVNQKILRKYLEDTVNDILRQGESPGHIAADILSVDLVVEGNLSKGWVRKDAKENG